MRIQAVVTDYDGTLTMTNQMSPDVVATLRTLKSQGVSLVLCTGRMLTGCYGADGITDRTVIELFDLVVGESGGVIWNPHSDAIRLLGRPTSPYLLKALADRGIVPVEVGHTMVNVRHADAPALEHIARSLGIKYEKVVGIDSIQYVTPGVRKSLGMRSALAELHISPRRAVAIGDGPNDVDMLDSRRNGGAVGIAVGNAVPAAKKAATFVLAGLAGDGFKEMAELVMRDGLGGSAPSLAA